jgi:hypothetical protein
MASTFAHTALHLARVGVIALAAVAGVSAAARSSFTPAPQAEDDPVGDPVGVLIGELVFQADLMSALDRLCPRSRATDWHGALAMQVQQAYTPELRELSRKLGAVAGAQLVRERGGCQTSGFAAAYDESRRDYAELLQRWRSSEGQ